ncbi:hypothetical protein ACFL96_12655 [Thermoproteota archaeon]
MYHLLFMACWGDMMDVLQKKGLCHVKFYVPTGLADKVLKLMQDEPAKTMLEGADNIYLSGLLSSQTGLADDERDLSEQEAENYAKLMGLTYKGSYVVLIRNEDEGDVVVTYEGVGVPFSILDDPEKFNKEVIERMCEFAKND